ncbi:MAG TPA: undecaprenyl-phosphate glucose phosphotransferase [Bacteroidota bacterium]
MPQQHRKDFLVPLLTVLTDALAIEAAFLVSYWLRFYSPLKEYLPLIVGEPPLDAYVYGSFVAIPVWLMLFHSRNMYSPRRVVYFSDEFFAVVRLAFFGMLMVMSAAFFYRAFSYSRVVFALLGITSVIFISLGRYAVLQFEQRWYARGNDLKRVLIVGSNAFAVRIVQSIRQNPKLGFQIAGYCSTDNAGDITSLGVERLGGIKEVPALITSHGIDIVLVALDYTEHAKLHEMVTECEGLNTEIMVVPDTLELMTSQVRIKEIEGIPFLKLKAVPMTTWGRISKRLLDMIVSALLLVLCLPLLAVIAFAITLSSKGAVLFVQERVGLDGKKFGMIKFRSMKTGAEQFDKEAGLGLTADPRQTGIGKFLRRWSLDELPQLLNVLKGEMSLVGPRPERTFFVEQYSVHVPKYLDRHRVKTGMTGWAQVNGLRGNSSLEERVKYDVYYIENWSLSFDLKIILKTIRAVLFGNEAH